MWVKLFTLPEFLMGLGLLTDASEFEEKGKRLTLQGDKKEDGNDSYGRETIVPKTNVYQYMPLYRFKEFRKKSVPCIRTRTCRNKVVCGTAFNSH